MFVQQEFITNGHASGEVGQALQGMRYDTGYLRPYFDEESGKRCVTVNTGKTQWNKEKKRVEPIYNQVEIADLWGQGINHPVLNATSLRKLEWVMLDQVVLRAARARLRAWADLSAANTFGGFNGMAKMILEHETMSDPGEAIVDMDGITEGRTDSPKFQLEGLPLPITHSDFFFSSRRLAVSRNSNTPLDLTMAEAAGRRVAEMIEQTLIGTTTGITYGDSSQYGRAPTVFGYTNFTNRNTYTSVATPTGSNATSIVGNVLAMRDLLYADSMYGPYMLYHSNDWDQYMDNDYVSSGGNNPSQTLRQRLMAIEGINGVRRLDFFTPSTPFQLLLVQMTPDVCRAVNGMDITTVQWESKGGMQLNFKVMCIQVPQLRADFTGKCGIVHGTTA